MFLLAFGIVDSENNENWKWFLESLKSVLPSDRRITFMSDRHPGLVSNIPAVFPTSYHGYCLWHLKNNFRLQCSRGNSEYLLTLFVKCAYAETHAKFQRAITILLNSAGPKVRNFIEGIPYEHWVSAYFQGEKYGIMCSSIAESFNNWISEGRDMPVAALVDFIRVKTMSFMAKRRDIGRSWTSVVVPNIEKKIKEIVAGIGGWTAIKSNDGVFEVHFGVNSNSSHKVDLVQGTCCCNVWRIRRLPCEHAVFCILSSEKNIYDYVDNVWSVEAYRNAYSHAIHPVGSEDFGLMANDEAVESVKVPDTKRKVGRPKERRVPNKGSEPQKKARICSKCNQSTFHNRRTCNM